MAIPTDPTALASYNANRKLAQDEARSYISQRMWGLDDPTKKSEKSAVEGKLREQADGIANGELSVTELSRQWGGKRFIDAFNKEQPEECRELLREMLGGFRTLSRDAVLRELGEGSLSADQLAGRFGAQFQNEREARVPQFIADFVESGEIEEDHRTNPSTYSLPGES